jgi:23S rRNA (guanosine2251-2'-O)-methyltransferase
MTVTRYDKLYGVHPVEEALTGQRRDVQRVLIDAQRRGPELVRIAALAAQRRIPVESVDGTVLRRMLGHHRHQGVMALVAPLGYVRLTDFLAQLASAAGPQALMLLDGVTDVGNFAALVRSAVAFGVKGILLPRHHSVSLTTTVAKRSAGAIEHIAVVQVGNVVRALEALKEAGFWIYGAERWAATAVGRISWPERVVVVLGGEERGMRRLVRERCDELVRIPMGTAIDSLNVATSGAIILAYLWDFHSQRCARIDQ